MIVRKDGRIRLYCKGADNIIYDRLGQESAALMELTTHHLNVGTPLINAGANINDRFSVNSNQTF